MSFGKPTKRGGSLEGSGLTKETQVLLEETLRKRGLSLKSTQDVCSSLKGGDNCWVDTLSRGGSRQPQQKPQSGKTATPAVKVPIVGRHVGLPPALPPSSFSGKRMQHQMPAPERELFVPGAPAPSRDAEKERCAQVMEYGRKGLKEREAQREREVQARAAAAAAQKPQDPKEALIDQLFQEVAERSDFLESMRAAGRAQEYESLIKGEIQQRLSRLKALGVHTEDPSLRCRFAPVPPWQRKT